MAADAAETNWKHKVTPNWGDFWGDLIMGGWILMKFSGYGHKEQLLKLSSMNTYHCQPFIVLFRSLLVELDVPISPDSIYYERHGTGLIYAASKMSTGNVQRGSRINYLAPGRTEWNVIDTFSNIFKRIPDGKIHGANMGPIWGRRDPGGPHVGPMNLAFWDNIMGINCDKCNLNP